MKVLKFGGTSVGSAASVRAVKEILSSNKNGRQVVVVSAFSGVTNLLHECSLQAASGSESYLTILETIESKHLSMVQELLPVKNQSAALSKTKVLLNELEDLMKGISLIGELSPATLDKALSFGETLSSHIIVDYLNAVSLAAQWGDTGQMIKTDSTFNHALVDLEATNENIVRFFGSHRLVWSSARAL